MAKGYEIHNHSSGRARNHAQIGVNRGNIWMINPSWPLVTDTTQEEHLQNLVDAVRKASWDELRRWGLRGQDALPVRWHTAAEAVFDYWEKIQTDADPVPLDGQYNTIRQTYEAVDSRRLVILGRSGAGKTVLAHRLILDLLNDSPAGPVPVLFSLGGWDPATELRHWLAEHLVRDFPFLGSKDPAEGRKLADVFIERGLILPFLDGFDEIPVPQHSAAIRQIGTLDLPLIVTSRPGEYTRAAHEIKAVSGAAAIVLEDLTLGEAEEYLLHSTGKIRAPTWNSVFEQIRTAPGDAGSSNLTAVLTSPLMVTLTRTVYNDDKGHDPRELLDTERFPTTEALEEHLLAAYLSTTYARSGVAQNRTRGPEWHPDQARRWLGYLATHLQDRDTHDLAWWRLPDTLHPLTRRFVTTTAVWLAFGLTTGLLFGGLWGLAFGLANGLGAGLIYGITNGTAAGFYFGALFGLVAGFFSESGFKYRKTKESNQPRLWIPPQGPQTRLHLTHLKNSQTQVAVGIFIGLTFLLAGVLHYGPYGLGLGSVLGLAVLSAYFVISDFGGTTTPQVSCPWTLLDSDRKVTLVRIFTTIPIFMVATMSLLVFIIPMSEFERGYVVIMGLVQGFIIGILIGVVRFPLSAWGQWLLFARLWLPLTRRLPWRPKLFLEDAYERGVLRRTGAVYQFRHVQLRDYLANHHRS